MFTDLPDIFGDVIREHRKRKQWSQMKLAMEAGLHLNALSNLERGKRSPTLQTVFLLAKALKVPPSVLVEEVEEKKPKIGLFG